MPLLSLIIPTYSRPETLKLVLEELNHQTANNFEVIVVNDGGIEPSLPPSNYPLIYHSQPNGGPASARNKGASLANSDIFLFIGDDTIPDRNLVFRHYYSHVRDEVKKCVQGYTAWHPLVSSEFQLFLTDVSGIQANWATLKEKDGSWKPRADGFSLTTNWSVNRRLFENVGGFNEKFKKACYEDLELGYRLSQMNAPTFLDPGATNYHLHSYTFDSYVQRQLTEGYWRLQLCLEYNEFGPSLISPESLRQARQINLDEIVLWAKELDYIRQDEKVKELKYQRWGQALQVASLKGVLKRLDDNELRTVRALEHVHSAESVVQILAGTSALLRGDHAYALHTVEWFLLGSETNWAAQMYAGEVYSYIGEPETAQKYYENALAIAPREQWVRERND